MKKITGKRKIKITLLMALTADGFIAKNNFDPVDWSSDGDKKFFRDFTMEAGVVIMGLNTYQTLDEKLKGRLNVVMGENKENIEDKDIFFFSGNPEFMVKDLENKGFKKAVLAGGACTNKLFYDKDLIDEIIFTVSPVLFGSGLSVFNSSINTELELKTIDKIDKGTILLKYSIKKKEKI